MTNNLQKTLCNGMFHGLKCKTPLGIMQLTQVNLADRWKYWFGYDHRINSKHFNASICIKHGLVSKGFNSKQIKPYLFSIDYLTKEIEFRGQRFVPLLKLLELNGKPNRDINNCKFDGSFIYETGYSYKKTVNGLKDTDWFISETIHKNGISLKNADQLRTWMFNVDGLEEDQFIRVTEELNPYK